VRGYFDRRCVGSCRPCEHNVKPPIFGKSEHLPTLLQDLTPIELDAVRFQLENGFELDREVVAKLYCFAVQPPPDPEELDCGLDERFMSCESLVVAKPILWLPVCL
jgi:hypothetical protein